jgi:hypothetical protein
MTYLTPEDQKSLSTEYPEGIPPWMLQRDYTVDQIRKLMDQRRRAFPKTKKEG